MAKSKDSKITYKFPSEDLDNMTLNDAVRGGMEYGYFSKIADKTPFTVDEWSEFLHLSQRTFHRYKTKKMAFDSIHTEKILQIAILYNKGIEVFGSKEKFDTWLNLNNVALAGRSPKSFLNSVFGIDLVNDELIKIERGILA